MAPVYGYLYALLTLLSIENRELPVRGITRDGGINQEMYL